MRTCARVPVFVLSVCILVSSALGAASVRAADDPIAQAARERVQLGAKYLVDKRYEEARTVFLQAYMLQRHPAILLNLAESELRSSHAADAANHFATYLREYTQADPLQRKDAEKGLAAAKARVGELTITVDAAGAEIFVDGEAEGSAPLSGPVYLEPGAHRIEARKEGKVAATAVQAKAGIATTANLTLGGAGAAPSSAPMPGADSAAGPSQQPPGESLGLDSEAQSPESDSGGKREPFLPWMAHKKLAWVGVGLTGAGLIGGVFFAIRASNAYGDADRIADSIRSAAAADGIGAPCKDPKNNPRPTEYVTACGSQAERAEDGDTQRTFATVSFLVAGVAAAGTVVYYIVDSKPKHASAKLGAAAVRVRVAPVVSSFGGVLVAGEF